MRSPLACLSKRRICLRGTTARHSCLSVTSLHVCSDSQHMANDRERHSFIPPMVSFRRQYFSNDPIGSSNILEQIKRKARDLLDQRLNPRGNFTPSHGIQAKHVLDFFKRESELDSESVNLSIALMERLVAEKARSNDCVQGKWVSEPRYFTPLLIFWKEAAKQGKDVITPQTLVQKLQTMSKKLPEFRYDIATVAIIMDALIQRAPRYRAPLDAEKLLTFVWKEAAATTKPDFCPNEFIYNNVIQAWAVSGVPQASEKMNALLHTMRQEGIVPTEVTYNILLRDWANKGAVDKLKETLDAMKGEGVDPSRESLSQAVFGTARVGDTDKAEEFLQQMLEVPSRNKREDRLVGECVNSILLAYRKIVDNLNVLHAQKKRAVECAEALFSKMSKYDKDKGKFIDDMLQKKIGL